MTLEAISIRKGPLVPAFPITLPPSLSYAPKYELLYVPKPETGIFIVGLFITAPKWKPV